MNEELVLRQKFTSINLWGQLDCQLLLAFGTNTKIYLSVLNWMHCNNVHTYYSCSITIYILIQLSWWTDGTYKINVSKKTYFLIDSNNRLGIYVIVLHNSFSCQTSKYFKTDHVLVYSVTNAFLSERTKVAVKSFFLKKTLVQKMLNLRKEKKDLLSKIVSFIVLTNNNRQNNFFFTVWLFQVKKVFLCFAINVPLRGTWVDF